MVKQDRARRTHALVLDAAAAEFAAQGFAATNLQVVAQRTGLTKGALYGHFASKAELAAELTRQFEESWQGLFTAAEGSASTPLQVLDVLLTQLADRAQHDARFGAGLRLVSEKARSEGARPVLVDRLRVLLVHLVALAQREGEIDAGHQPELLAQLMMAVVFGLQHTSPAPAHPDTDQTQQLWRLLLPAMRHPAP
ncbi:MULTISPECIES: TetR family transcriptional regulator [unclassified Streptomyces]|uniref:TetR family transcriptional regulator n=1 Tax=unclassified Streptomyces TaxID=2593676 RepID=UPI003652BE91